VIEVRRAADRFVTRDGGAVTWHCFSYGAHYDAANTNHGRLVACNDVTLKPGAGFPDHPHRGIQIVTWVASGALAHADSTGAGRTVRAGETLRLDATDGIEHSETNASDTEEARFVQAWLLPGEAAFTVLRLAPGEDAAHVHLYVATGGAVLGADLGAGDSLRLTRESAMHLTATGDGAEILVWATS
jgi:redox-sensitive bicupin YhaK (pirin superfamily)